MTVSDEYGLSSYPSLPPPMILLSTWCSQFVDPLPVSTHSS